jgi:plastocyanin
MTNRVLRLAAVLLLALSGLGLVSSGTVLARQGDDCAGIEEYIAALEATGVALEAAMPADDDSDLESWTSDDFTAASDALEAAQESFDAIEPPAVAEEFHALLLEQFGLLSQMFDTMAAAGIFGALIFVEQLEGLETQITEAAQAIETACGVELTETIEGDDVAATPVAVTDEVTDESDDSPASAGIGTRENPIPLGQTARIHPDWEMTVVSVTPDATAFILGGDSFNEPPAEGQQFFLATVRLTYIGETSDEFYISDLNAVGHSAVGYNQFDDYCGTIPDELPTRELFTGGTIEGNVCWSVATEDADSLVLYDNYGPSEERVYLSMMPSGSAGLPPTSTPSPAVSPNAGAGSSVAEELVLDIKDIFFEPTTITVQASDLPVTIAMENTGGAPHNFTIDALNIDVDVDPGKTVEVVIPAGTAPGTYDFYCNVPGHREAGMVGTLVVQ